MTRTNSKNWVIFDMDEVVVNIRTHLAKALNAHSGKNIHESEWHTYSLESIYNIETPDLLQLFHSSQMLEKATLEEDALLAMTALKNSGFHIGVLTARAWHVQGLELTLDSIKRYQLPVDVVKAVGLHVKKQDVIKTTFDGNIVGFIDDNPAHVIGVSELGIPTMVRDRPWNTDILHIPRAYNLMDFVQYLESSKNPIKTTAFYENTV